MFCLERLKCAPFKYIIDNASDCGGTFVVIVGRDRHFMADGGRIDADTLAGSAVAQFDQDVFNPTPCKYLSPMCLYLKREHMAMRSIVFIGDV